MSDHSTRRVVLDDIEDNGDHADSNDIDVVEEEEEDDDDDEGEEGKKKQDFLASLGSEKNTPSPANSFHDGATGTACRNGCTLETLSSQSKTIIAARSPSGCKIQKRQRSGSKYRRNRKHVNSAIKRYVLPCDVEDIPSGSDDVIDEVDNDALEQQAIECEMREIRAMYGIKDDEEDSVEEDVLNYDLQPEEEYCETDLEIEYSDDDDGDNDIRCIYQQACKRFQIPASKKYLRCCHLPDVVVRHEAFGVEQCRALGEALEMSFQLVHLDLSDTRSGDASLALLASSLYHIETLQHLDFSRNIIGMKAAKAIADLVSHSTSLRYLNLSHMALEDIHLFEMKNAFEETLTLETLDLSGNQLDELGGIYLHDIISKNSSIEVLNVSWNSIRMRGAMAMLTAFKANSTIHTFYAGWNGIADYGCMALSQSLKVNTSLRHLDITNNRISFEGCKHLASVLNSDNRTLEEMYIGLNPITNEGAVLLVEAVIANPTLTSIDASQVPISQELMDRVEDMIAPTDELIQARSEEEITERDLQEAENVMQRVNYAEGLLKKAEKAHEQSDNHHDQVITYAFRDAMQKFHFQTLGEDCLRKLLECRSQRRIAEAFAHPRTQVLKTHEAAVKFVQAHEAALDAFLACHGTAKERKAAAASAYMTIPCDVSLESYMEGYEDGTYVREIVHLFVERALDPHLRAQENVDDDKLSLLFQDSRKILDLVGGPKFAASLESYIRVRTRHPKDNMQALETAEQTKRTLSADEEIDEKDKAVSQIPPQFDDLAIFEIACAAAQKAAAKNERDTHAISEAAHRAIVDYALAPIEHHDDLVSHITRLVKTQSVMKHAATSALNSIKQHVDRARLAHEEAVEKVEQVFEHDVANGKRPNLKLKVDDGRCHATKTSKEPWILLEEYLERHNLRLLDLFKRFDRNSDGQITIEEFKHGVQVIGVQLADEQIESLIDSMDINQNGSIDYFEMCAKRSQVKTSQAQTIIDEMQRLNRARSTAIGMAALGDITVNTDIVGRTGGGLNLHQQRTN